MILDLVDPSTLRGGAICVDLHNDVELDLASLSWTDRRLTVRIVRCDAPWVHPETPSVISLVFEGVSTVIIEVGDGEDRATIDLVGFLRADEPIRCRRVCGRRQRDDDHLILALEDGGVVHVGAASLVVDVPRSVD